MNSCEKEHYEAIKETLIEAYRDRAEKFADDVDKAGYGVRTALEQLYQIYRGR